MTTILVFGDSIAYGCWDHKYGGWVGRLRDKLDKRTMDKPETCSLVYNLSVDSDFTSNVSSRFEAECKSRLKGFGKDPDSMIIFSIGLNDSMFVRDKNDFFSSEAEFRENLLRLVKVARRFTPIIVFVGLTPVDERKMDPNPWYPAAYYKNDFIRKFESIIREVSKREGVMFVGIFDSWIGMDYKRMLSDGIHPTSEGHLMIFKSVYNFLTENKLI